MFEAVSYHLPKSRSFQQATKGKPRHALARIRQMLGALACDPQIRVSVSLSVDSPSEWLDAAVALACIEEARQLFGPEDDPSQQAKKTWDLAPALGEAAMEFALSDERWPRQQSGPIHLFVSYHFNWLSFPAELPEPLASWQHGTCLLLLNFNRRSLQVAPRFVFPVPYESVAFQEFITRLSDAAPFDIKPKYFRRMLVNPKNGAIRELRVM